MLNTEHDSHLNSSNDLARELSRDLTSGLNAGSNLNPNHNEAINSNRNRFDDLMNTITEARKSLLNWQDQKTEALIKLDAISYDIRMIGEEKEKAKQNVAQIRQELESEVKVYQNHIENLTDQLQSLQMERETLQSNLNQALIESQANFKEMTRLLVSEQNLQEELKHGIARMQTETETRLKAQYAEEYNGQIEKLKLELQELNAQNSILERQRNDAEDRAEQNERELGGIRSHMMSVLRVADEGSNSASSDTRRNEARKNDLGKLNNTNLFAATNPEPKTDPKKLRAVEIEAGSVDEYLKRLGY